MSDEDKDVDIESDDEDYGLPSPSGSNSSFNKHNNQFQSQADKRAHHNALERKRRDHIKDSFSSLRDAVPALQGEKVSPSIRRTPQTSLAANDISNPQAQASRAQILKKAAEYIQFMRRKNTSHQQDIDDLKRQNKVLEEQIRALEKAKMTGNFAASGVVDGSASSVNNKRDIVKYEEASASDSSDMDEDDDDDDDDDDEEEEEAESSRSRKKLKTIPDSQTVII